MSLQEEMTEQGNWFFRWRSYLPFVLLPLLAVALNEYERPLQSERWHHWWSIFCLAVSLLGLMVRCLTAAHLPAGTSGRNTRRQVAEQLNTLGIYSTVRHPLYLGNYLIGLGIFLAPFHGALATIYTLTFWLYYERIMVAEEAFLLAKFSDSFGSWAASTPAFVPKLSLWKPAALSFSLKTLLRREYTGLLVVVASHTSVQIVKNYAVFGQVNIKSFWLMALSLTTMLYFTLRGLKKHTHLLAVDGR